MSTPRPNWRERGYDARYDRNRRRVVRDETICWICGLPVDKTLPGRDPRGPSVDHVIPRSAGGTNDRSNLRLTHLSCNSARAAGVRPRRQRPAEQHPGITRDATPAETPGRPEPSGGTQPSFRVPHAPPGDDPRSVSCQVPFAYGQTVGTGCQVDGKQALLGSPRVVGEVTNV